ncbi:MAG: hypothetical protein JJU45_09790 [Acidimicrobiia bacterium]|nr:hypothetical protein [Acidimicrobiia bacterium]
MAAVGAARGARLAGRFEEATDDFAEGHFDDVLRVVRPMSKEAPGVPEVRELHGLTLYRLGRWQQAARELEAYRDMTSTLDRQPVLADCYRALGRWADVDDVCDALLSTPSLPAPVATEGRIVAAGSLADRGELRAAIALLDDGWKWPKRPKEHHVRRAYALADLYERAGDLPQARRLFGAVAAVSDQSTDAAERLESLG